MCNKDFFLCSMNYINGSDDKFQSKISLIWGQTPITKHLVIEASQLLENFVECPNIKMFLLNGNNIESFCKRKNLNH